MAIETDSGLARVLGLAMFLGPVALVYTSSLSGFYEAQVDGGILRLRALLPRPASRRGERVKWMNPERRDSAKQSVCAIRLHDQTA